MGKIIDPGARLMLVERRRVIYEGQVQGVGFRMTARRLATGFPVAGYVRNLPDGRVELVVVGEPQVVTSFLQAIHREFGDMIRDVREEPGPTEAFSGFTIRH